MVKEFTGYINSDETVLGDAIKLFELNKNILLKGPTGSGKTRLAETLSEMTELPMHQINCSVDLDAESLLGFKTIKTSDEGHQEIVFIDGPVIRAMREGHILYIDEINMAKPETLPILNGVLDYRRQLTNPFTGEVIKAAPGFKVIAAINEGYVGTLPMNEALKNRFVVINVNYIDGQTLHDVIKAQSLLQDDSLIDQIIKFNADLRTMTQQGQLSEEAASIRALIDMSDLATVMPIERAIQRSIIDKLEDEREQQAIMNAVELNFLEGDIMSDRFIMFNDEQLDAMKMMMLQDLARLLLKNPNTQVKVHKFPYYDAINDEVICSSFWAHRPEYVEHTGLKTDVLLATYSYFHMDPQIVNKVVANEEGFNHPKLYRQLFKMMEEMRILNLIERERPRTQKLIQLRKQTRQQYSASQMNVYQTKTLFTDLFFLNLEYSFLRDDFYTIPHIHPDFQPTLEFIYQYLPDAFQLQSSEETMYLTQRIMYQVDDWLEEDMLNEYYHIPRHVYEALCQFTLEDLKRIDAANTDQHNGEKEDDVETEKIESKNIDSESAGGAYLEMELHEGENSDVLGDDSAREGDSTDDMTDMMSKKGKGSNDTLDDQEGGEQGPSNALLSLKGINQYVDIKWHVPDILPEYIESYRQVQTSVQFEIKDLIQIIKKTIDREYQDVRANLTKGRLQRNLVNWFIDDQYKLFYKKADQSRTFDATFTLLIDASASMHDKMDETIKGVVLFHETLKALNVKHEILAFNEDAFDADAQYQPNIIDEIINYHQSTFNTEAPRIMSLTPQDDNRDGVAIRVASDRLLSRSEQQRFLIVFSDGEPSAFNYSQDGILDTYEAVENSRKLGIEVFNVFLSQESITESTEQTIHNIYGQYAIFVEGVEHLPSLLSPLLKKLLLKSF